MKTYIIVETKPDKLVAVYVGRATSSGQLLDAVKPQISADSELKFFEVEDGRYAGIHINVEVK